MADPAQRGFAMPPEWAPHEATWMAWPVAEATWVAGLEPAEDAYVDMVEALVEGERVELLAPPGETERVVERLREAGLDASAWQAAREAPPEAGLVRVHAVDYADSWLRDTGPTVLTRGDGARLAVDWLFDAWGGKYEALERDDALAEVLAKRAGLERVRVDEVLEGGAVDVDGTGRVLATESCLLHENRGGRTRGQAEALLAATLGADDVVWLAGGLAGDDTDGHVDTVARFTGPGEVLALEPPPEDHPDHEALAENLQRLENREDLTVDLLPTPGTLEWEGRRLPATYANFYVADACALVPQYGDPADERALAAVEDAIGRPAVPVDARGFVVGYGACHCLTQQLPAAP